MCQSMLIASWLAIFLAGALCARAADDIAVETLLEGLAHPCGVAIRPSDAADRYEVFVADSGAGRVIRFWNHDPKSAADVVTGFELTPLGASGLRVGPLGLLFLDRNHLVVSASGKEGASVKLFELSEQPSATSADKPKQQVAFPNAGESKYHVYALARTRANDTVPDALVLTSFADDEAGDLRKIAVRAGTLGELESFGTGDGEPQQGPPAAIATGQYGYIVVGWIGSLEEPRDSRLAFYNPLDGSPLMRLSTELYDLSGLAYTPKTGNLYAVDAAWMDAENGGVFRIDDASQPGAPKCVAVKIADALRPSGLAFGPDGALYVTAIGELDDAAPQGVLLRITGDL